MIYAVGSSVAVRPLPGVLCFRRSKFKKQLKRREIPEWVVPLCLQRETYDVSAMSHQPEL